MPTSLSSRFLLVLLTRLLRSAPPWALGVNIMQFCQAFNAETQDQTGTIIPVEITVYEDKSFTFMCKTPPAAVLIKEKLGLSLAPLCPS